ncbi:methyltransferase domain-containing protein [Romeria aff. gracilis LEGE 07310]|uniref:Methyltransferase domain-containing protein n=1 Tax=Vasconcelosia minhoensis LEGE 07310 TaxID=915328 RepID=A0A8J7ARD5_9CYAN|nr:methyltransferase domain-containing protein [Romeria gracilis]MBE9079081.1 methyltransferase domain-containing protein [Romeria aff. gracilis LEGE 07310]
MKHSEEYTPGYTQNASNFMAQRSANNHAAFLMPHLQKSSRLLDCGCGPGSISCDFASVLTSGHVIGIDRESSQIELARNRAVSRNLTNITFNIGSIYELPFSDSSFDVVFAHAIFEHLASPNAALSEVFRVLVPGGIAAIRSPDWGGFLVSPDVPGLEAAIDSYAKIQVANGGDVFVGRKLPGLLRSAGFDLLRFSATYDCCQSPQLIAEYLALKLPDAEANTLRLWSQQPDAVFAQAWCEILGTKTV